MWRLKKTRRTFHGKDAAKMDLYADRLCTLSQDVFLSDGETEALAFAIACIDEIMRRAEDGKRINFD